ncbi:MAG: porin family protein, partial [Polaribacter sp.]
YAQLFSQPNQINKSGFSYAMSAGFIKDVILNKKGSISIAGGIGYGYNFFNHKLKVEELNSQTFFSSDNTLLSNKMRLHHLEFPLEIRWRTSSANKYKFWRIYTGIKFLYNLSNTFEFTDASNNLISYSNISSYNKFQYGLTLSAGYDAFNIHVFYGLTPIFKNATIHSEAIDTKTVTFGLIFYIL